MDLSRLAYAITLLDAIQDLIQIGADVNDVLKKGREKLQQFKNENRDPSDAEWDELNASIATKRDRLHS